MNRIEILSPDVASRIAAGEVITRPASVVKELVENSLDAGAAAILIDLEDGGCRGIRVVDDGHGMTPEEAPLSLLRHATSKLRRETDLLRLITLGFRGEALPSIAAVSRMELTTRAPGSDLGLRLQVAGGELLASTPWAGAAGTRVTVADLFFNTPARQRFLRTKAAEQGLILELVRQLALAYPEVHFTLTAHGKTLLTAPAPARLTERFAAVCGLELVDQMLPVASEDATPYALAGLVSSPDYSVATTRYQFFTVNRRLVSDRMLTAALREAYQGLHPRGRHPAAVLHLTVPPDQVDVNVHPTKAEIRFKESGRLYGLILNTLRRTLAPLQNPGRQAYRAAWQPESGLRAQERPAPELFPATAEPARSAGLTFTPIPPQPAPAPEPLPPPSPWRFADLPVLGQIHRAYILAQAPEGLLLIDQHAAHERLLYERLDRGDEGIGAQALLFPQTMELEARAAAWLTDHLPLLSQAGLEVEPFGGVTFLITSAPAWLAAQCLPAVVEEVVAALAPGSAAAAAATGPRERVRQIMACRGAIKAGQELTLPEMHQLLQDLDALTVNSHCPHGRPLWRLITLEEIRQLFFRPRH